MNRFAFLILAALLARPAAAQLPPDLAAVPPSAVGFVHARVGDVLKHKSMAYYRDTLDKAGARAFAAFDDQFTPRPSSLDRVTVVGLLAGKSEESFAVILHFSEPFDLKAVANSALPQAVAVKGTGKPAYSDGQGRVTLYAPEPSTLVVGSGAVIKLIQANETRTGAHPLKDALTAAASPDLAMFAAVNVAALPVPPQAIEQLPEPLRPLAAAQTLTVRVKLTDTADVAVRLGYADEAAAKAADKAARDGAEMLRKVIAMQRRGPEAELFGKAPPKGQYRPLEQMPEALGAVGMLSALGYADSVLADLPVRREGAALAADVSLPAFMTAYVGMSAVSVGLMLPAVQQVRAAAARQQSVNNLKQIALAMHNYHDVNGTFPPAAIVDKKGKPLLSWRVAILPYIEQNALYAKFKLDEPWDGPNNKQWSNTSIKTYMDPRNPAAPPGTTQYKVFTGKDAGFPLLKGRKIQAIADGTSNTLMAVAAGDPVPWAKPEDIEFDMDKPAPDLTTPGFEGVLAAFMDGSVRYISYAALAGNKDLLKWLVNPADGHVLPNF